MGENLLSSVIFEVKMLSTASVFHNCEETLGIHSFCADRENEQYRVLEPRSFKILA